MAANIAFRVTDGLDAAGKSIINVGYPDITAPLDGVNVKFFIDENTIQQYDKARTYKKDFAVIYNNRVYVSLVNITTPEDFNPIRWRPVRTDPSWRLVTTNAPALTTIQSGEHIIVQSTVQDIRFTLPAQALNGDMVVIRDNGTNLHDFTVDVDGNGRTISGVAVFKITAPYSAVYFILSGSEWIAQVEYRGDTNKKIIRNSSYLAGSYYKAMVGDQLMRETQYSGGIKIGLPKYANHGDTVTTYDLDGMNPVTKTTISVHPDSTHNIIVIAGQPSVKTAQFDSTDWGILVFDRNANAWRVFDSDSMSRWKSVKTATYSSSPNDQLVVYTQTSTEVKITFPKDAANGDSLFVDTRYMVNGSSLTLSIDAGSTNDYFLPDGNTLTNPRISAYRDLLTDLPSHITKTQTFAINNRGEQMEFVYFKNALGSGNDVWALVTMTTIPYRVDRTVPDFYGMASIASQASVNKNKEDITTGQNPDCEDFVTSETLANKTATGTRRGIIRLSTNLESKATTGNLNDEAWSGVAITPFLLNDRLGTTSMRGVFKVATQAQANAQSGSGENWGQVAITPQTLAGRISTETMPGLIGLVNFGGTKQPTRTTKGTGVHDFTDHSNAVTPKTLFEKVATEFSQGMVFVGNQNEVNTGAADNANGPLVVTATTLNGRQATSAMTGLTRAATAAEVISMAPPADDNVHVTPKGLVSRTATETRTGLGETSTQAEVDAGTLHDRFFVSPKTFGNWLVRERLTVVADDGLTSTGNIWQGQQFGVVVPTEIQRGTARIATQAESNDMSVGSRDDVILTPRKLSARMASTSQTGILYLATQGDVDTGTNNTKAVTPLTNLNSVRSGTSYRMTDARYGVGMTAVLTNNNVANSVFEGNDIAGSTRTLSSYAHGDIVVSPRGLNTALMNFLPKRAVAVSADAMDEGGVRVPSSDWVRRTIAQTITGVMTFSANPLISGNGAALTLVDERGTSQITMLTYKGGVTSQQLDIGVNAVDGPLVVNAKDAGGSYYRVWTLNRNGNAVFTNNVSNGGFDPTHNDHLTRYGYTEIRYVKAAGGVNETITGQKTFNADTYFKKNGVHNIWMGNTSKSGISIGLDESISFGSLNGLSIRPNGLASPANVSRFEPNGDLRVSGQVKIMTTTPVEPEDAIRKDYLDSVIDDVNNTSGTRVFKGGDTMTGELIINSIKALTANGDVAVSGTTTLNKLRIAVGNGEFLEIRANPVTKSVDFVWIS